MVLGSCCWKMIASAHYKKLATLHTGASAGWRLGAVTVTGQSDCVMMYYLVSAILWCISRHVSNVKQCLKMYNIWRKSLLPL